MYLDQTCLNPNPVPDTCDHVGAEAETFDQRGMTTAEYAVGTVAAASFGTILIKILTDEQVRQALLQLILRILEMIMTGMPSPF